MAAGTISGRGGVDLTGALGRPVMLSVLLPTLSCAVNSRYLGVLEDVETGPTSRSSFVRSHPRHAPIAAVARGQPPRRRGVEGLLRVQRRVAQAAPGHRGAPIDARLAYAVGREALRGLRRVRSGVTAAVSILGSIRAPYGPRETAGRALDRAPHTRH